MNPLLTVAVTFALIGAFALGWVMNDARKLTRDFATVDFFDGHLVPCLLTFPTHEFKTECLAGANSEGLYLTSPKGDWKTSRWSKLAATRTHLSSPLFIPWTGLTCTDARFPLRGHVRFDVARSKATFFMPKDTVALLGIDSRTSGARP